MRALCSLVYSSKTVVLMSCLFFFNVLKLSRLFRFAGSERGGCLRVHCKKHGTEFHTAPGLLLKMNGVDAPLRN